MEHYTWDAIDKEILSPTIARKIIAGEKAMVAQVFLAKGAVVPEHKHESEQITYILEGALLFEIDGKEILVGKGQVLRIPSWKPHKATALEDTLDLDIFSPIREDWLKKDDEYLRWPGSKPRSRSRRWRGACTTSSWPAPVPPTEPTPSCGASRPA